MNLSKLQSPASSILLSFAVKSFTIFSGDFFFGRGVGGIAGAYGLKLLPTLCNIPFSFVGQRFQEPESVIFLGNFFFGGGGGKGERERGKRDIACAR